MADSEEYTIYKGIRRGECSVENCLCEAYLRTGRYLKCANCSHQPIDHRDMGREGTPFPREKVQILSFTTPAEILLPSSSVSQDLQGTRKRSLDFDGLPTPAQLDHLPKDLSSRIKNQIKPFEPFNGKNKLRKFLDSISDLVSETQPKQWLTLLILNLESNAKEWHRSLTYDWTYDTEGITRCKKDLFYNFPQRNIKYEALTFLSKPLKHATAFHAWIIKFERCCAVHRFDDEQKKFYLIHLTLEAFSLTPDKLDKLDYEKVTRKIREKANVIVLKLPSPTSQNRKKDPQIPANPTPSRYGDKCRTSQEPLRF